MAKFSFIEKLEVLKNIIFSSADITIIFLLIIGLIGIFLWMKKTGKKITKKWELIIYFIITIVLFIKYGNTLLSLFDGLMDNIFTTIYFPTPVAYIIMIVITNIIMIRSILNKKVSTIIKNMNIISYIIISFLSFIALDLIIKNHIDIYSKTSIYTNTNLLVIIELAMITFAVWVIILSLMYIIERLTNKVEQPRTIVTELKERPIYHYNEPILNEDYSELPDCHVIHEMIQKERVISSNPHLYDQNGNVKFPKENLLEEIYYQQQEKQVDIFKSICQKEELDLTDYKQLKSVLSIAIKSDRVEQSDLEKLISKFE